MTAIDDIAAERRRQVESEGWTAEHDDFHDDFELSRAASCYASVPWRATEAPIMTLMPGVWWPWSREWWKPTADKRRNLVKAGALIVAEIERLDRAATPAPPALGGDEPQASAPMTREEIRTAAANRIAARKAPDAAEVVVPRRPSPAMLRAGARAVENNHINTARGVWSAMISTAEQEGRA